MGGELRLFALETSNAWGGRLAERLGVALAAHEEREFAGGEHKARPLVDVRGADAYVLLSTHGDATASANDRLVRLALFCGAVRDAGAAKVTAIAPYLAYSRKDRKTKTRDPVSTRYVAAMLEAVGVDRMVTLEVHNLAAWQNAFRIQTEHLEAKLGFVSALIPLLAGGPAAVVSPDVGGVKRAEAFRAALASATGQPVPLAFVEKHRSAGELSGGAFVGDVQGATAVIYDDLVSSGGTLVRAAEAALAAGATRVMAAVTHATFTPSAEGVLDPAPIERLLVADSVPPLYVSEAFVRDRLVVVDTTALFAGAIACMHHGGSIEELLGEV